MINACPVGAAIVVLIVSSIAAHAEPAALQARQPRLAPADQSRSAQDLKAVEVLSSVRDRLAAARTLSFVVVDSWESRADEDTPRIQKNRFEVTVKRPDKLRVLVSSDAGLQSQVNCNGRTMLTYTPATKAVAIAHEPPVITDCLKEAYKASGGDFPFIDLIIATSSSGFRQGLQRAHYLGQSQFGGANTDVVSFSDSSVLLQMWVATDDKLPRAILVTSADDPHRSRQMLTLSNWQIDAAIPPDAFTALKGISAEPAEAIPPRPVGTSGIQSVPTEGRLTIHTYGPKYWGAAANVPPAPYGTLGYYQSPDGYGYYPPQGYAFPPASAGYYGPCFNCGEDWPEGAPEPGFNLSLSTSGWYQPEAPAQENPPAGTYWPGQIVSTLPVGCASQYPGPAFYLCGGTWFAGIVGPDGTAYFRVVGGYGY